MGGKRALGLGFMVDSGGNISVTKLWFQLEVLDIEASPGSTPGTGRFTVEFALHGADFARARVVSLVRGMYQARPDSSGGWRNHEGCFTHEI